MLGLPPAVRNSTEMEPPVRHPTEMGPPVRHPTEMGPAYLAREHGYPRRGV